MSPERPTARTRMQLLVVVAIALALTAFVFVLFESSKALEKVEKLAGRPDESIVGRLLEGGPSSGPDYQFRVKAALERDLALFRHKRAMTAVYVRTWIKFLGVMFGALMVLVGCTFVLARIREPRPAEVSVGSPGAAEQPNETQAPPTTPDPPKLMVKSAGWDASLRTAYPGVVLAAIGAVLIAIPNLTTHLLSATDGALFLGPPIREIELPVETEKSPAAPTPASPIRIGPVLPPQPLAPGNRLLVVPDGHNRLFQE